MRVALAISSVCVVFLTKLIEVKFVPALEILGLLWVYRVKDVVNVEEFVFDDIGLFILVVGS